MDEARVRAGRDKMILDNDRDRATMGDGDPSALLAAALHATPSDPEIMESVADLQGLINPSVLPKDQRELAFAWKYLACKHGGYCEGWGDPVPLPCAPNGQDCGTVPSGMLQSVNNNWAPIQALVQQIEAAMNAGQWGQVPGLSVQPTNGS